MKAKRMATSTDPGFEHPRVDREFLEYLPVMSAKDDNELSRLLLQEGCRENVVVWDEPNIVIDGHRRSRLCEKLGIPYRVEYRTFESRDAVLKWMRENQLYGKRNLTDEFRRYLLGKEAEAARASDPTRPGVTAKVAKKAKVSRRKVQLDEKFAKAVDAHEVAKPGTKAKILAGGISTTKVLKTAPVFCSRCTRIGRPVVDCAACADLMKKKPMAKHVPKDLFDTPVKKDKAAQPLRDDYEELRAAFTRVAALTTAFLTKAGPNGEVNPIVEKAREYMAWAGLLEFTKGKPRFIPFDGVNKLLALAAEKGQRMMQPAVLEAYKVACGAVPYVPPATKFRRERRGE